MDEVIKLLADSKQLTITLIRIYLLLFIFEEELQKKI